MLPGGLFIDGRRRRDFVFRPLTGEIELLIAAEGASDRPLPRRVTATLAATLETVAGLPATKELAGQLCVPDRQFLMRRLAARMGLDSVWLTSNCADCGAAFDVLIVQSALPIKPAGEGFPFAEAALADRRLRLRTPTGDDQEAVVEMDDERDARRHILERCVVGETGRALAALEEDQLDRLDASMEAVSPELVLDARVACPACAATSVVSLDPYLCLRLDATSLFGEVHELAWAYHWSEASILALPVERRRYYLRLVDRAHGRVA